MSVSHNRHSRAKRLNALFELAGGQVGSSLSSQQIHQQHRVAADCHWLSNRQVRKSFLWPALSNENAREVSVIENLPDLVSGGLTERQCPFRIAALLVQIAEGWTRR